MAQSIPTTTVLPATHGISTRYAGGSSMGSGAAVAAGVVPGALGTDTTGSIRNPATWCGVVGLKPSYGLVPLRGVVPLTSSLDHVGPMARSAADCAHILEVIAGVDPNDPTSEPFPPPPTSTVSTER